MLVKNLVEKPVLENPMEEKHMVESHMEESHMAENLSVVSLLVESPMAASHTAGSRMVENSAESLTVDSTKLLLVLSTEVKESTEVQTVALHGKENTTININLRATDGNMKRFDIEKEIGTTLGQKGATVATMTADLMLRLADMKEEVETQMCTDRMETTELRETTDEAAKLEQKCTWEICQQTSPRRL